MLTYLNIHDDGRCSNLSLWLAIFRRRVNVGVLGSWGDAALHDGNVRALIAAPKPVVVAPAGLLAANQIRTQCHNKKQREEKHRDISAPPLQQYVQCLSVIGYAMCVCVCVAHAIQASMAGTTSRRVCALIHDFSALDSSPSNRCSCLCNLHGGDQIGIASRLWWYR
jgi:hypothetical protein